MQTRARSPPSPAPACSFCGRERAAPPRRAGTRQTPRTPRRVAVRQTQLRRGMVCLQHRPQDTAQRDQPPHTADVLHHAQGLGELAFLHRLVHAAEHLLMASAQRVGRLLREKFPSVRFGVVFVFRQIRRKNRFHDRIPLSSLFPIVPCARHVVNPFIASAHF